MNASKKIKNTIVKVAVACVLAASLLGTGTGCDYRSATPGAHKFPAGNTSNQSDFVDDEVLGSLMSALSAAASGTTTRSGHYY